VPLIEVTLVEGRTPAQLRELISALTHAAAQAVDAPVDSIRVVVREVPTTHWGAGDVTIAERRGAPDPRDDPYPDNDPAPQKVNP
jgi:4-oxalocrotonate tautomerase